MESFSRPSVPCLSSLPASGFVSLPLSPGASLGAKQIGQHQRVFPHRACRKRRAPTPANTGNNSACRIDVNCMVSIEEFRSIENEWKGFISRSTSGPNRVVWLSADRLHEFGNGIQVVAPGVEKLSVHHSSCSKPISPARAYGSR